MSTNSNKSNIKITEYSEDLKVYRPKYNVAVASNIDRNAKNNAVQKTTPITQNDTKAVDNELIKQRESNKLIDHSIGYRIQLYSGNNKSEFESVKMFLYKNYPQLEVYESFTQPTYRIKLGDFIRKTDAEEYVDELKSRFTTARIINEKINTNKVLESK